MYCVKFIADNCFESIPIVLIYKGPAGHVEFSLLLQVIDKIFCICCKIYMIGMALDIPFL